MQTNGLRAGNATLRSGGFAIEPVPGRGCDGAVSLNRSEQMIQDYLLGHADERQHWRDKVQMTVKAGPNDQVAADRLQAELWAYFVERSAVVEPFRGLVRREGLQRTSMRNLAEYLIRLWTEPKPKRRTPAERG